jgi:hypothetical protein
MATIKQFITTPPYERTKSANRGSPPRLLRCAAGNKKTIGECAAVDLSSKTGGDFRWDYWRVFFGGNGQARQSSRSLPVIKVNRGYRPKNWPSSPQPSTVFHWSLQNHQLHIAL